MDFAKIQKVFWEPVLEEKLKHIRERNRLGEMTWKLHIQHTKCVRNSQKRTGKQTIYLKREWKQESFHLKDTQLDSKHITSCAGDAMSLRWEWPGAAQVLHGHGDSSFMPGWEGNQHRRGESSMAVSEKPNMRPPLMPTALQRPRSRGGVACVPMRMVSTHMVTWFSLRGPL